jgi:hypothetical protein
MYYDSENKSPASSTDSLVTKSVTPVQEVSSPADEPVAELMAPSLELSPAVSQNPISLPKKKKGIKIKLAGSSS